MRTFSKFLLPAFILIFAVSACKKDPDNPDDPNEEEVITTITLSFTDSAGVAPAATATFRDPDGDGGAGPDIFDNINLQANTTYNVNVKLLNETESPAEDITLEIQEEDDEHLFCYTVGGGANVQIERTDTDGTYEVGLLTKWVTGAASNGTVQVVLKHQPDIKDGTCAPGESDIEVTFTTNVQ